MKPSQIISALHTLLDAHQPVFLWGPPGVGKSQVVAQVAAERELALRDIRAVLLDPVDLRGLPRIENGLALWCPPAFLPAEDDKGQGIIFLDELNAAPPLVQAACYQLILDRRIGEYRLPDGWRVMAAGNREQDKAVTHRMPSALANRMVHLDFEVNTDDWLTWAESAGMAQELVAFIRFRPKLLHDFDPLSACKAFASPRSWSFVSKILENKPDKSIEYELLRGTVGDGAAAEFMGFLNVWRELPAVDDVLSNPKTAPVPSEPTALYAICEALGAKACSENAEALVYYAQRLPAEFGVLLMREAVIHDENLVQSEAFSTWATANAHILM
ncbi:MAG: MoxR family ATPase [Pseudomonadota bacterium]